MFKFEDMKPVLESYSYILKPWQVYTAAEFAALIAEHYSLENERNKTVYEYVKSLNRTFKRIL